MTVTCGDVLKIQGLYRKNHGDVYGDVYGDVW